MSNDYIEIDLEVVHTTQDAFLLTDGDTEDWIPVSTIVDDPTIQWYDYSKGDSYTFEIAEWILIDKGFI